MAEIVFHPNHVQYEGGNRHEDLSYWCDAGYVNDWTCKKTASESDLYLFYSGKPLFAVTAMGVCDGQITEQRNRGKWDWTKKHKEWFCAFEPLIALHNPLLKDRIEADGLLSRWWAGLPFKGGPKQIRPTIARHLLELIRTKNRDRSIRRIIDPYLDALRANGERHQLPVNGLRLAAEAARVKALDCNEPPAHVACTIQRVIRDTPRARRLKRLYENRCQICNRVTRIPELFGGAYCEVHHLRPLGGDHEGYDDWRNMMVVCPTCHAELDLLAIGIEPKTLRVRTLRANDKRNGWKLRLQEDHTLASGNLRYHWRLFHRACH